MGLLKKLFGTSSEKELRAIKPIVDKIEALDGEYSKLTDEQLKAKTPEFKQRIANGESLDDILPAIRTARTWTPYCPRRLPPAGRRPGGCWA